MTEAPPLDFTWTGEAMVPLRPKLADRYFTVGQTYRMEERQDRSARSHNHYFASVAEAHSNLPDDLAERFPTEDHLRKWALIKAGYRDERSIVCASKAEARRVAAFVKPMDEYAVVVVRDVVVIVYTAQSQSTRAMGAKAFQESKTKVLDIIARLIGTSQETLAREGRAA